MAAVKCSRRVGLKTYINSKINMLENEFYIRLTNFDRARLRECNSHDDVDLVAHDIIAERL